MDGGRRFLRHPHAPPQSPRRTAVVVARRAGDLFGGSVVSGHQSLWWRGREVCQVSRIRGRKQSATLATRTLQRHREAVPPIYTIARCSAPGLRLVREKGDLGVNTLSIDCSYRFTESNMSEKKESLWLVSRAGKDGRIFRSRSSARLYRSRKPTPGDYAVEPVKWGPERQKNG